MLHLLPAIETAFYANGTLTAAFPGNGTKRGLVLNEDWPDDVPAPVVRVAPIAAPRTQTYDGAGFANPQIQFDVFAKSNAAARTAMLAFIGQWDTITLTLTSGAKFYGRRTTDPMPLPGGPEARDEDDNDDVWGWTTTYEYAHT